MKYTTHLYVDNCEYICDIRIYDFEITRRVYFGNNYYKTYLSKIDGKIDFIEFHST